MDVADAEQVKAGFQTGNREIRTAGKKKKNKKK